MTIIVDTNPAIAAQDYTALIALVGKYLNRSDLNDDIPAFIELATRRFNRVLFTEDRNATIDFVATGSTYTIPSGTKLYRITALFVSDEDDTPLEQVTFDELKRLDEYYGRPGRFALWGNTIYLDPQVDPDGAGVGMTLMYEQGIPLLGGDNPSNWLLEDHPDIYLYGSLVQAEAFLENDARVNLWKSALDEAMDELIRSNRRRKFGSAPLTMNVDVKPAPVSPCDLYYRRRYL